jgi:hypothetical protein
VFDARFGSPGLGYDLRMRLKAFLRGRYEQLVCDSCSEQPFPMPSAAQRYFNNAYSSEYVAGIRKLVGDAQRALVVGD